MGDMVSASVVADALGISRRQVSRLVQMGELTGEKDEHGHYQLDLDQAVEEYAARNGYDLDMDAAAPSDWGKERIKQDALMKRYKANMLELQYEEMRGSYHRSEFVRDCIDDLVFAVRAGVLALPGKLAPRLAVEDDPAKCAAAIKAECVALLESLSEYEYSEAAYHARLAEARGKEVDDGD